MTREDLVGSYACKTCGTFKQTPASRCYYCKPKGDDEPVRTPAAPRIFNRSDVNVPAGVKRLGNGSWSCIHGRQRSKCTEGCAELPPPNYERNNNDNGGGWGEEEVMGGMGSALQVADHAIVLEGCDEADRFFAETSPNHTEPTHKHRMLTIYHRGLPACPPPI